MKRPYVTLTKRQMQGLLTLPEEAEIRRKEQKEIIAAALKLWENGKVPDPDEVIRMLKIPSRVRAGKSELGQVVAAAQEIAFAVAKNGKKPRVSLTKRQVYAAVEQLAPKEKTELLRLLMQKEQQAQEGFAEALKRLRKAYAQVPVQEVEKDVRGAVKMVREERLGKRRYR